MTVRNSPRLDEVDVVRGMALGGMLLVNLGVFSGAALIPLERQSGLNWLSSLLVLLLAEGKFYPLFAFLFGWGVARRQCSFMGGERAFFWPNLRRMLVLAGFGLLHAALLWEGDILFAYALLGIFLPLLLRVPARIIARLAILALLLSALLTLPFQGGSLLAAYSNWINSALTPYLGLPGRLGPMAPIPRHITLYLWKLAYFPNWLGNFAALILLGYLAGQSRSPKPWLKVFQRPGAVLILAIPLNLFFVMASDEPRLLPVDWAGFLRVAALSLGGPLLALSYALGIIRWCPSPRGQVWLEPLRQIGRMPLTTYLCQSLVCVLLFSGIRPGGFAPVWIWPLAALIFILQMLFARWWLRRHPRGPVETAWRWISNG